MTRTPHPRLLLALGLTAGALFVGCAGPRGVVSSGAKSGKAWTFSTAHLMGADPSPRAFAEEAAK